MTIDIFEDEQRIYDYALARTKAAGDGIPFDISEYANLTKEYGKLLKQLRRSTRIADRTAIDLHESNLDLADKVHYDALTRIYNRRYIEDSLKRIIKSLSRSNGVLSILMMDIDFFKKYNDTYGHSQGDSCLKTVAETLTESLSRPDDFVARYGGEEFIIVLPSTDENGARLIADKVLANLRAKNIPHEKSDAADCVTISIGITSSAVSHEHSGCDYIRRADEALYMSKQDGRDRYTYVNFRR